MTTQRFRVEMSSPAVRTLGRLNPKIVDAVLRFLDGPLADNPWRVTKPLGAELEDLRSGYVGISYRVLVRIDEEKRVVYMMRIAHRADAYPAALRPGRAGQLDRRRPLSRSRQRAEL